MSEFQNKSSIELIEEIKILQKKIDDLEKTKSNSLLSKSETIDDTLMFSLLAENSTSAIMIYTMDKICYINSAGLKVSGYTEEELLSKKFWELSSPEMWESVKENGRRRINGEGISSRFEFAIISKSGKQIWLDFSASLISYNGQPALLGVGFDVTDKVELVEQLKLQKAYFQQLFEGAPEGVVLLDNQDRIVQANAEFIRLFGFNEMEIIGKAINTLIVPDKYIDEANSLTKKVLNHDVIKIETIRKCKDGREVYVSILGAPIIIDKNQIGVYGIYRDISRRKKAEQDLIISEERYKLLTENSNDMISKYSRDGIITYISPVCREVLGYEPEDYLGHSVFEFVHPDESAKLKRILKSLKLLNRNPLIKHFLRRKDGVYILFETSNQVVYKQGTDEVIEIVCVSRDLTEIFKREELMLEKEAALLANKAKSEFLANLSHEIRNPMNVISGLSKTLERTQLTDDQKKYVESIIISSNNMMNILNSILDFSKIEANKIEIKNNVFNLSQLITEIEKIYANQANEKGILFTTSVPDLQNNLYGDEGKLRQILINLVGNAFKFTEKGYINLDVVILISNSHSVRLKFDVSDSGIGIEKHNYNKLFQSFLQLDSSTTKQYSGTGLGLAIVKSYAELLSGNISFTSEYKRGSCFTLELSFNIEKKEVTQVPDSKRDQLEKKGCTMTILLVEDDAINQLYLRGFFESKGCKVDSAYNGLQAIEKFKKNKYCIIFMDGQMPKMDGFEATRKIREIEKSSGTCYIHIVVITGYAVAGDRERFIEAGMDDHITKPVDENRLYEIVEKFCIKKPE